MDTTSLHLLMYLRYGEFGEGMDEKEISDFARKIVSDKKQLDSFTDEALANKVYGVWFTKETLVERLESFVASISEGQDEKQVVNSFEPVFIEDSSPEYNPRTKKNAQAADITVAFALDFSTYGEKLTKTYAGDNYIGIELSKFPRDYNAGNAEIAAEAIKSKIIDLSREHGFDPQNTKINIAGNGMYTLNTYGISQETVDKFVTDTLSNLLKSEAVGIESIRSGGQTGIDEAGIKAAMALNIPSTVLAPKGWRFRIPSDNRSGHEEVYDEAAFKNRFALPVKKEEMSLETPERKYGSISVVNVKTFGGPEQFEKSSKSNVYIGRRPQGNVLGNPFTHIQGKQTLAQYVVGSRQESVDSYAAYYDEKYGIDKDFTKAIDSLYERVKGGEDITLGCWCKPQACHGDIIKEKLEKRLAMEIETGKDEAKSVSENKATMNIYAGTKENFELSNLAWRPFMIEGRRFTCVEQYYQWSKAVFAGDNETAEAILATRKSGEQKQLGKKVKGLDQAAWDVASLDIMRKGVLASFMQNDKAKDLLLSTGDVILTHIQDDTHWREDFPSILMSTREELKQIKENQNMENAEKNLNVFPEGSVEVTFQLKGHDNRSRYHVTVDNRILNYSGEEVFKNDSSDRRKILANAAIRRKQAVMVTYRDTLYVVYNNGDIISGKTGDLMRWSAENGNRKEINALAEEARVKAGIQINAEAVEAPAENIPSASIDNAVEEEEVRLKAEEPDGDSEEISAQEEQPVREDAPILSPDDTLSVAQLIELGPNDGRLTPSAKALYAEITEAARTSEEERSPRQAELAGYQAQIMAAYKERKKAQLSGSVSSINEATMEALEKKADETMRNASDNLQAKADVISEDKGLTQDELDRAQGKGSGDAIRVMKKLDGEVVKKKQFGTQNRNFMTVILPYKDKAAINLNNTTINKAKENLAAVSNRIICPSIDQLIKEGNLTAVKKIAYGGETPPIKGVIRLDNGRKIPAESAYSSIIIKDNYVKVIPVESVKISENGIETEYVHFNPLPEGKRLYWTSGSYPHCNEDTEIPAEYCEQLRKNGYTDGLVQFNRKDRDGNDREERVGFFVSEYNYSQPIAVSEKTLCQAVDSLYYATDQKGAKIIAEGGGYVKNDYLSFACLDYVTEADGSKHWAKAGEIKIDPAYEDTLAHNKSLPVKKYSFMKDKEGHITTDETGKPIIKEEDAILRYSFKDQKIALEKPRETKQGKSVSKEKGESVSRENRQDKSQSSGKAHSK